MPDISMCNNKECTLRKECYRYMAIPEELYQSYMEFKPDKNGKCEYFHKIENRRICNKKY